MMWYWGGGVHWWEWLIGLVGMVAFWGLIIYAGWYFFTGLTRGNTPAPGPQPGPPAGGPPAKQILDERLARGEIDAEEYRRLRELITGADRSAANGSAETTAGTSR
jgi:putative membrane protein